MVKFQTYPPEAQRGSNESASSRLEVGHHSNEISNQAANFNLNQQNAKKSSSGESAIYRESPLNQSLNNPATPKVPNNIYVDGKSLSHLLQTQMIKQSS